MASNPMCDVAVWWLRLSGLPIHAGWGESMLVGAERQRDADYRHDSDRRRFRAGVVLMRLVLSQMTSSTPQDIVLDRTCQFCGKPHGQVRCEGGPYLSLTHSGDVVGLAVCRQFPVGVDAELDQPVAIDGLLEMTMSEHELSWWTPERSGSHTAFYRTWVRKEAVVKLTGDGMRMPLPKVVVTRPDEPAGVISYGGSARRGEAITLIDLEGVSNHPAALAVHTRIGVRVTESVDASWLAQAMSDQ